VTLRLEVDQIAAAKAIALWKSVPYQTLIRMWISEALVKELRQ
jgi:predicted DNA binding CopG/RHH family protein